MGAQGRAIKSAVTYFFNFFSGLAYAKDDAASLTAKANRLYKEGKYDQALSLYSRALIVSPDSVRLNFNIGAANYKKAIMKRRPAILKRPRSPKISF